MLFFSGFGFRNEKALFRDYLKVGDFTIAGFSYGAQRALEEAKKRVQKGERVESLQLFSPAYFNELPKPIKLKELQNFTKNGELYMRFFYKKAAYPWEGNLEPFKKEPSLGELKALLFYEWKSNDLQLLKDAGVDIEVYLGSMDKIVDSERAKEFFKPFAIIYTIKDAGHLLR